MYITRQKTKEILSCYSWMLAMIKEANFTSGAFCKEIQDKITECEKVQDFLSENVAE